MQGFSPSEGSPASHIEAVFKSNAATENLVLVLVLGIRITAVSFSMALY